MPQNIAEIPEFLDEIEIPEGGDNVTRAVLVEAYRRLANRTRNLALRLGGRTGSGLFTYRDENGDPITKTAQVNIQGVRLRPVSSGVNFTGASSGELIGSGHLQSTANQGLFLVPLEGVPSHYEITAISAYVIPGAARAGANRMRLRVGASEAFDDGTTNEQFLTLTGLSITPSTLVTLRTGADSNSDTVIELLVNVSSTGVR